MLEYDWPGNVRELENAVQHMVALHSGPALGAGDLPSALRNFEIAREHRYSPAPLAMSAAAGITGSGAAGMMNPPNQGDNGIIPLSEVERRAILRALEYTRGDRAVAAHLLGIGRTTLYRKLKEYEVAV